VIDDGTIFHIVCSNFQIDTAGIIPFEDEVAAASPPAAWATTASKEEIALRTSCHDVIPSFQRSELALEQRM
jgi:hypothetical protein